VDGGRAVPERALRRVQRQDLAARSRTAARKDELATESRDSEGRPRFAGGGTHASFEAVLATGLGAAEPTGLTLGREQRGRHATSEEGVVRGWWKSSARAGAAPSAATGSRCAFPYRSS
jgi:hypothetical protein